MNSVEALMTKGYYLRLLPAAAFGALFSQSQAAPFPWLDSSRPGCRAMVGIVPGAEGNSLGFDRVAGCIRRMHSRRCCKGEQGEEPVTSCSRSCKKADGRSFYS
ncbi:hypothetical protein L596_004150 [Steinernema carpocapsae]|uniref:Uncharacterized protein n=1 Tax=Steinernema carpocapsae TaxID=34508 RepID=A0A4U8UWH2_STECR|nr:hypothetical protein L596_004150 [Steinernema carpocapsae]